MIDLFGSTRTVVKSTYALLTPDGFVNSSLPGWKDCRVVVNISPVMGARFAQLIITLGAAGSGAGNTGKLEYFVYVFSGKTHGKAGAQGFDLDQGSYVFLPPGTDFSFAGAEGTELLIFQKPFEPSADPAPLPVIIGHAKDVPGNAFMGNDKARLQVLLPDEPRFDMAVNIFIYQPGATLPFVETHVMEHGMLMVEGQGIYRI
jgi:(S)-ureidoglycine aminohydrolase